MNVTVRLLETELLTNSDKIKETESYLFYTVPVSSLQALPCVKEHVPPFHALKA